MMMRLLAPSLLSLALCAAASAQPVDDYWRSTPWPSTSQSGNEMCFIAYQNGTRGLSVTAMGNGNHFMSVNDPAFNSVADGANVSLVFPSGWRATVPSRSVKAGALLIGIDEGSFNKVLDELGTAGTLTIAAGGASISVPVPDQLDGRIRNLRGPMWEGSVMDKPCTAQFTPK